MTNKEIEKRCLEEMQQNIPDAEALWQRIESQLPPQNETEKQPMPSIRMQQIRRILPIAACLLLIVSGSVVFLQHSIRNNAVKQESSNNVSMNEIANENFEAEDYAPPMKNEQIAENDEENTAEIRSYASLNFSKSEQKIQIADHSLLGTHDEFFLEEEILKKTECFVFAVAQSGEQDPDTGEIIYQLRVQSCFGIELQQDESLIIRTNSPYILQPGHEYILPLYKQQEEWKLAFECAPQLEMTLDGEVVFHNGWQSLKVLESERILYHKNGADDYFYDRMYITDDDAPEILFTAWESVRSA